MLAMPISWKGTLQQYAGRLHREHASKLGVLVHDYVDTGNPALERMWQKRQRAIRPWVIELKPLKEVFAEESLHS